MDNTPRFKTFSPASEAIRKLTEKHLQGESALKIRLLTQWYEIAGAVLAEKTLPMDILYARGANPHAILKLKVSEGFATEIHYHLPALQERITLYFGYKAIDRFQLVSGAV